MLFVQRAVQQPSFVYEVFPTVLFVLQALSFSFPTWQRSDWHLVVLAFLQVPAQLGVTVRYHLVKLQTYSVSIMF